MKLDPILYNSIAETGNVFVLTEKGYKETPDRIKAERKIGHPLKGYERGVPASWIKKGYVEEKPEECLI
ncbi:MAG: hypothetical protein NC123_18335 [Butyrivibrio sp.]|nr:hypothetical protein [Acetatifactor muris]MCM1561471.1 hypothetical protein [Butyrivibrio sp.]